MYVDLCKVIYIIICIYIYMCADSADILSLLRYGRGVCGEFRSGGRGLTVVTPTARALADPETTWRGRKFRAGYQMGPVDHEQRWPMDDDTASPPPAAATATDHCNNNILYSTRIYVTRHCRSLSPTTMSGGGPANGYRCAEVFTSWSVVTTYYSLGYRHLPNNRDNYY